MKRPGLFRETDVRRAVKATQAAGLTVAAVEIAPDGTIRVLTGLALPQRLSREEEAEQALDAWRASKAGRRALGP